MWCAGVELVLVETAYVYHSEADPTIQACTVRAVHLSCVCVSPPCVVQVVTNARNTLALFKNLLGRTFSDPYVQELRQRLSYEIVEREGDKIGVKVRWSKCCGSA